MRESRRILSEDDSREALRETAVICSLRTEMIMLDIKRTAALVFKLHECVILRDKMTVMHGVARL
jgi:hypothetical protein